MKVKLSKFRCGTPRKPGEGWRIGTVRYLPRGVHKEDYQKRDFFDVWLPILSPSRELVHWYLSQKGDETKIRRKFRRRYEKEMSAQDPRQVIQFLARVASVQPVAVGCYCEDENLCHRPILFVLIAKAAEAQE